VVVTPLTFSFDAFGFDIDYYDLLPARQSSLPLNVFLPDKCTKLTKIDVVSAAR
jgi:hypothetical protein